jgi:PilZ domain-containing protein
MGSPECLDTDYTDPSTDDAVKKMAQYLRLSPRRDFAASVEVIDPKSGKQIVSMTSNVSRSGCHVRTSTPFQSGTRVKVTIKHQGTTFNSDAEVVYAIPGAGMGLHFENPEAADVALNRWLAQFSTEILERVQESTYIVASGKQKIVLVLSFVVLAAIVAGVLVWSGVRR